MWTSDLKKNFSPKTFGRKNWHVSWQAKNKKWLRDLSFSFKNPYVKFVRTLGIQTEDFLTRQCSASKMKRKSKHSGQSQWYLKINFLFSSYHRIILLRTHHGRKNRQYQLPSSMDRYQTALLFLPIFYRGQAMYGLTKIYHLFKNCYTIPTFETCLIPIVSYFTILNFSVRIKLEILAINYSRSIKNR